MANFLQVNPLGGGVTRPSSLGEMIDPVDRLVTGRPQHKQPNLPAIAAMAPASSPAAATTSLPVNPTTGGPKVGAEDPGAMAKLMQWLSDPNVAQGMLAAGGAMSASPGNVGQVVGAGYNAGGQVYNTLKQQDVNNEARQSQIDLQERSTANQEKRTIIDEAAQRAAEVDRDADRRLRARQLGIQENSAEWNQLMDLKKFGLDEKLFKLRADAAALEQAYGNINTPQAGIASLIVESWVASGQIGEEERSLFMPDAIEMATKYEQDADTKSTINDMVKSYVSNISSGAEFAAMDGDQEAMAEAGKNIATQAEQFLGLLTNDLRKGGGDVALSAGLQPSILHQRRGDSELQRELQASGVQWGDLAAATRAELLVNIKTKYPNWDSTKWETE